MAPKKNKSKEKDAVDAVESSQSSQRSRAKKYTKAEIDMLVKVCADFHGIINKNSNKAADIKQKTKTWEQIKRTFDTRCRAEAIFVSFFFHV